MPRLFPLEDADAWGLKENDRIYINLPAKVQPLSEITGTLFPFEVEYTFVASLNVDKKFKIYYGDAREETLHIAARGYKMLPSQFPLGIQIFSLLVSQGWELIY